MLHFWRFSSTHYCCRIWLDTKKRRGGRDGIRYLPSAPEPDSLACSGEWELPSTVNTGVFPMRPFSPTWTTFLFSEVYTLLLTMVVAIWNKSLLAAFLVASLGVYGLVPPAEQTFPGRLPRLDPSPAPTLAAVAIPQLFGRDNSKTCAYLWGSTGMTILNPPSGRVIYNYASTLVMNAHYANPICACASSRVWDHLRCWIYLQHPPHRERVSLLHNWVGQLLHAERMS